MKYEKQDQSFQIGYEICETDIYSICSKIGDLYAMSKTHLPIY